LKALDQLAKLSEGSGRTPTTPPPTAVQPFTPVSDDIVTDGIANYPLSTKQFVAQATSWWKAKGRTSVDELTRAPPTPLTDLAPALYLNGSSQPIVNPETNRNSFHNGHSSTASNPSVALVTTESNSARPFAPDSSDLVVRRLQRRIQMQLNVVLSH